MASPLSPAKLVLLASHFATNADLISLSSLAAQHATVLHKEVILRILLTYLPETLHPNIYIPFLKKLNADELEDSLDGVYDTSFVDHLSDEQASKAVKKLRLLQLAHIEPLPENPTDPFSSFLFRRCYRMDEEAGMLARLPDLLLPFLQHAPAAATWMVSTILPLLRRNYEYYPQKSAQYSLLEFQNLPDRKAVEYLLAETGTRDDGHGLLGRDLRGLIGPWLYNDSRWEWKAVDDSSADHASGTASPSCAGWEQILEWLVTKASTSWKTAFQAIEEWDGPQDVDLGHGVNVWLQESQQQYLDQTYGRAVLASAYLSPEATVEALAGAYQISRKIKSLMDQDSDLSLESAASNLSRVSDFDDPVLTGAKAAGFLRNELLSSSNPLTAPSTTSIELLMAIILSAFLLTRAGMACTVRRAGDLAFLKDKREQKNELTRLIRAISSRTARTSDDYWIQHRREILWLHNWGCKGNSENLASAPGIFSMLSLQEIEIEILRALLSDMRYDLARSLYEESHERTLPTEVVQNTVQMSALAAFDNASNPNRTRGGLKKCSDIIEAFPKTMNKSLPATLRIEALLKATHALSDYRLVLKQGEPFNPVVLRVHSDPISIIDKVLEQNPQAYTRLQEFLEMGVNMVNAGLNTFHDTERRGIRSNQQEEISIAEKRIVAMAIRAALREDDFETAYSYVVSRLGPVHESRSPSQPGPLLDEWSWKAALDAGKYVRTERSQRPTHLGTASGNLEIRHLEQRIECLATALRIAPPFQLQEVLKTFRRCEEQLDSAIKEEAAKEDAWDVAADLRDLPGAFDTRDTDKIHSSRNMTASAAARQAEEAPMSLFDLSRATARVAQRNFNALSNLQGVTREISQPSISDLDTSEQPRARKRDQLREAATGTLVSSVGWLIGASVNRSGVDETHGQSS